MIRHRLRRSAAAVLATAALVGLVQVPGTALAARPAQNEEADQRSLRGAGQRHDALLVRVRDGASDAAVDAAVAAAGALQVGRLDEIDTRVVTPQSGRDRATVRRALRASRDVLAVENDGVGRMTLTPDDPLWDRQWSARRIRAPRAWDISIGRGGPIIAILDTGVGTGHADLSGRVLDGRDFVNNDRNAADDNGHGTLVAGVAAAAGNNDRGVAGTCWRCRILPVKVINSHGSVRWSNAAAGIIWATDHGAQVINMSFGAYSGNSTLRSAVAYAVNRGVVVIGAAGNDGRTAKFFPAAYDGVLSVAATNSSDGLYSWSNRGGWVKVAAPGCTWTTRRGGGYDSFCGTSASAPAVAGVAGLMLEVAPGASSSTIKAAIRESADAFTWRINGGRLDALGAIDRL